MSQVSFSHLSKKFGDTVAVDDLTLEIPDREFMVLLGPSGCGKTTALRMVAGLETITSGELAIGDRIVNEVPASDRDIAMVFQSYALYPHMTVRKNIESPLVARRTGKLGAAERSQRVQDAAEVLGLETLLDRKPGALSGGQRQRVALARAIVRRPEVFLMDEPLSNLDAKLRTQTRLELVELWRRLETTFIYVTHDQVEAMTMGSKIAVLTDGKLQQAGPPQEVYERPVNIFVASFIGSPPMNLAPATLETSSAASLAAGRVGCANPASLAAGAAVTVGIRPEHVVLGGSDLAAKILNVELLGHERHVICQVDDRQWVVRQSSSDTPCTIGDSVTLGVDPNHVHVFDSATTMRIN